MRLYWLAILLILISTSPQARSVEQPCFKLAYYDEMAGGREFAKLLKNGYAEAGLCADLVPMPLARAAQLILDGSIDADIARTASFIEKAGDSIVYVPTPVFTGAVHLLTLKASSYQPQEISDMNKRVIGAKIGTNWATELIERSGAETVKAHTIEQLLSMLKRGRMDGLLIDGGSLALLKALGVISLNEISSSPPLMKVEMFHVLNPKHEHLIPKLDAVIQRMSSSRLIERTVQRWMRMQLASSPSSQAN